MTTSLDDVTTTLTGLYRYPVKSCRRDELQLAEIEPWGLLGDRRWMLVDTGGAIVTARECPRLLLVDPQIDGSALRLRTPGMPELTVKTPDGDEPTQIDFRKTPLDAIPAAAEAHAWFSAVLDVPVRLVYLDDPTRRQPNPRFSEPDDRVSFADGYPLLLTTSESLAALNDAIAEGRNPGEGPLPMTRFRPNVVVSGAPAWAEDGWRRLRIGSVTFRSVKGCPRCVITMTDPESAARGKEPIATLARIRRWDGEVWFGMNLIPDAPKLGDTVALGDPVEILEDVASDGPPR